MLAEFKAKMKDLFEMPDLGLMTYFLGIEVRQAEGKIFLGQRTFALKVLSKFSMENCKPTTTPIAIGMKLSSQGDYEPVNESIYRSLVGCLLYLIATKPDILFAVNMLSRFMHYCNVQHFQAAKRVLRYIKGSLDYGVLFNKAESLKLRGYTDNDWAGSSDDMKSTSGYAFTLGSTMFCWSSRKQPMVAQSTAEAEYVAAANAVNQAIWVRKILADLNLHQREAT
ncbi:secreted RxLR effector protein 161-like [Gossypium hirsutum]|uniref:Secreted RxLR effector protein 161-like n=1 Tax=Gossypium hirsutum TaxID=3635 RepID=A0A1U8JVY3_GOSHI|nr:secreted RxLR effector protein 161-like [Gossypium hirsutum]